MKITQDSQLGASKRSSNGLLSQLLQPFAGTRNLKRSAARTTHSSHDVAARAVVAERQPAHASAGPAGTLSGHSNHASEFSVMNLGFSRDLESHYLIWREIGRGGNGVVKMVTDQKTGQQHGEFLPQILVVCNFLVVFNHPAGSTTVCCTCISQRAPAEKLHKTTFGRC